jgi:curved DNA-binding protein
MTARFVDYYNVLGVKRDASQEDIQRAYRTAARTYHPDMNKEPEAQKKFQEVQEAYEVLKEPERRKRYDQLGADYKPGQEFRPPQGWGGNGRGRSAGAGSGGFRVNYGGDGGPESAFTGSNFSEFFESLFGGGGAGGFDPFSEAGTATGRARGGARSARRHAEPRGPRRGADAEAELLISLADAALRATKRVSLTDSEGTSRTLDLKIPAGVTDGATIRLAGQGGPGSAGGPSGDLLLRIRIAPDARFRLDPADPYTLISTLQVAPWEAALGAKVPLKTIDSEVTVTIPPGTSSGQRMRIRGQGLPNKSGERADLIAELRIVVPKSIDTETRVLYEQLAAKSNFDPRAT